MDPTPPKPQPFPPGETEMPPGSPEDWIPFRRSIPPPESTFHTAFGRWLERGAHLDEAQLEHAPTTQPWWRVIWLTAESITAQLPTVSSSSIDNLKRRLLAPEFLTPWLPPIK